MGLEGRVPMSSASLHSDPSQSSGAVRKSRWLSWAFRPNEPYGFCGRKAALNHACLRQTFVRLDEGLTGHNLSLICQPTSEDMKPYIIIASDPQRPKRPSATARPLCQGGGDLASVKQLVYSASRCFHSCAEQSDKDSV